MKQSLTKILGEFAAFSTASYFTYAGAVSMFGNGNFMDKINDPLTMMIAGGIGASRLLYKGFESPNCKSFENEKIKNNYDFSIN